MSILREQRQVDDILSIILIGAASIILITLMPRRLRLEYEGAIYHVMTRGNARQDIVQDDDDRNRLLTDLERSVLRCDWELLAFAILSNHLHLLLKTPQPNLGKGMQAFLSGYAVWSAKRRQRPGHLFQGHYKAEMIEDESYYWTVSRYIHLNPVRAGLVAPRRLGVVELSGVSVGPPWSPLGAVRDTTRRLAGRPGRG